MTGIIKWAVGGAIETSNPKDKDEISENASPIESFIKRAVAQAGKVVASVKRLVEQVSNTLLKKKVTINKSDKRQNAKYIYVIS